MPWRGERDPYRVWLSEVILQQTRVAQGEGYYRRFVAAYPDVAALAAAEEDEVLALWQGLGYYSRARNLHAAAKQVVAAGAAFPREYAALLRLPGVGPYSAAAIASFVGGEAVAVVDGNVYRVLARVFRVDAPIDRPAGQRTFRALAQHLLLVSDPGAYNQAIMDFGATVCTPRAPRCASCPLRDRCVAWREGRVGELPVKTAKLRRRRRYIDYLHLVRADGATLLRRRGPGDVYQGLYDLPAVETAAGFADKAQDRTRSLPSVAEPDLLATLLPQWVGRATLESISPPVRQQLSHQELILRYWRYRVPASDPDEGRPGMVDPAGAPQLREPATPRDQATELRWYGPAELTRVGLPRPLARYLEDPSLSLPL